MTSLGDISVLSRCLRELLFQTQSSYLSSVCVRLNGACETGVGLAGEEGVTYGRVSSAVLPFGVYAVGVWCPQ